MQELNEQMCPHCRKKWVPDSMEKFIDHVTSCRTYKPKKISKYKNKRTEYNGMMFDSGLEAEYCKYLDRILKGDGIYAGIGCNDKNYFLGYYLRQVKFDLPGNTSYRCDFMEVWETGSGEEIIKFIDTKGMETETFKLKKKLVESLYPVTIEIIKKGDF